jgi:hypothetical protein
MSAENVIINFQSDTGDLQKVDDSLDQIIAKDEVLEAQWKKTGAAMTAVNKTSAEQTTKLAKSIDQLATASKTLDKSVIAGAYKTYLKDIQNQLGLTQKELVKYVENARKAAQAQIITADDQQAIDELTLSIEVMNEQLAEFQREEEKTTTVTKTLKQQLREAKNELAAMAEAGLQGTPAFEELRLKAGELDDQIKDINQSIANTGSDTKNIDGLVSLAGGVAGGFAAAQGAIGLFGDENEDLQKALLKVNSAMAILQGLQQVSIVLQKESSASILINNLFRRQQTVATVAQTVAVEGEAVATGVATAATKTFSAALIASPVGLIVLALTAAAVAFSVFSNNAEDATEKMEKLKDEAEKYYESLLKITKVNQEFINRDIAIAKNEEELKTLELKGDQEERIADLKNENINLQRVQLQLELNALTSAQNRQGEATQFTEREIELKKQIYQLDQEQLRLDIERNQALAERSLKNQSALADAEVARRKLAIVNNEVDTINSIKAVSDAEIAAIRRKQAEELNDPSLSPQEEAKIIAEANLAVAENRKALQLQLLTIEKTGIDARVKLAQAGSIEEYNAKLEQLEAAKKIEEAQAVVTGKTLESIYADYTVAKRALDKTYNENKIQDEISYLNSYLENVELNEDRRLELTIRRLDLQRDLEISQAENNAAKIAEINAKYDNLSLEAKRASIKAALDSNLKTLEVFNQINKSANEAIVNSNKTSFDQKRRANDELLSLENSRITLSLEALEREKDQGLITANQYQLAKQELLNQQSAVEKAYSDRAVQIVADEQQRKLSLINQFIAVLNSGLLNLIDNSAAKTALQELANLYQNIVDIKAQDISDEEKRALVIGASVAAASAITNQLFADARAQRQTDLEEELSALDEAKNRELNNKNLTEQQKADIQKKYDEQAKVAKRAAFIADKDAKKSEAVIQGVLAALKAFPNFPLMALAVATTALTVAKIDSTPVPRFKKGKVDIQGPGTTTSDSIPAYISNRESVINAAATAKWKDALLAINDNKFENYLAKYMSGFTLPQANVSTGQGSSIDYVKLAKAIAQELPEPTYVNNLIDKDGIRTLVINSSGSTEFKNEILSMR